MDTPLASSLERTAPGLHRDLRALFGGGAVFEGLAVAYGAVIGAIGPEAPEVRREEGASFNPRPARICHILLKDGGERRPEVLAAALASLTPHPGADTALVHTDTVKAVQSVLQGGAPDPLPEVERIVLAVALDEVRHLHMTSLDTPARLGVVKKIRTYLDGTPGAAENRRLIELVEHAVRRAEVHLGANDG